MINEPTLQLPGNEPEVLTSLLDAAVRQSGLQAAGAASYFAKKIALAKEEAQLKAKEAPTNDAHPTL